MELLINRLVSNPFRIGAPAMPSPSATPSNANAPSHQSAVFLVSGASRGLGREIVRAAAEAGHRVVAGVRTPASLDDLAERYGEQIAVVPLDVTDDTQVRAAVRTAVDRFGRLDVLVNNAGYANVGAVEDVAFDDFRAQIDTNLLGVVRLTQAALPVLREQGSGHIVQVSSVGGRLATPGLAAYQSAKWAVGGFSSVLAAEVAPLGIKVTVLEPGGMSTEWAAPRCGSTRSGPRTSRPWGRWPPCTAAAPRRRRATRPRSPVSSSTSSPSPTRRCGCSWAPTPSATPPPPAAPCSPPTSSTGR